MRDERTPRDDEQPRELGGGFVRSVVRSLGALARALDATHGAGGGVADPESDRRADEAARKRRDYRP